MKKLFRYTLYAILHTIYDIRYTNFQEGFLKLTKSALISYLIIFIAFSGTGLFFLFNPFGTKETEAAWFNDNWAYRKAITVTTTSTATDRTDVDVLLTIDTNLGSSKLQSACQDLRFTSTNGEILPYYIPDTTSCNSNSSNKIWVRVDLVPKNATSYIIYMYYGNPVASAGSDAQTMSLYNGLQGFWKLNESSGNANDSSANANTLTNNNTTTYTTGQFANAASFASASSQSLSVADGSQTGLDFNATNKFSIATWVNPSSTTAGMSLASKDGGNGNFSYAFYTSDSGTSLALRFGYGSSFGFYAGNTVQTAGSFISTSTWTHIVLTYDGSYFRIYKNGVEQTSGDFPKAASGITFFDSSATFRLGGNAGSESSYLNGLLDDSRIFNRALSATEITNLYNGPSGTPYIDHGSSDFTASLASEEKAPSPVAYWKFDEGQGVTAQDSTTNNFDGSVEPISLDSDSSGLNANNGAGLSSPQTFSHTVGTCANSILIVRITSRAGSGVSAVTYNGDSMTQIRTDTNGVVNTYLYRLVAPDTGSNTVSITHSGLQHIVADGISLCGVDQTNPVDANNGANGSSSGPVTVSLTTTIANTWIVDAAVTRTAASETLTMTSMTNRVERLNANSAANGITGAGSSVGPAATAGSYDMEWTKSVNNSWAISAASFKPANNWQTEDQCISGKCLNFDKAGSVVTAGSPAALDDLGPMTLSAWVYPRTIGETAGVIMAKEAGVGPVSGWDFRTANASGNEVALAFEVDGSTDLNRFTAANSSSRIRLNQWSHVALTWDGTFTDATTVKIYINGREVSYSGTINGVSRVSDASSTLRIGNDSTGATTWDGKIDEPKIYNYVRSAAQIKADYNSRSNPEGVAVQEGNNTQNLPGALANGLVGYWKLNESSGNATDDSGNGETLTNTNTATFTAGKFGNSGSFVGASSQYFACTDTNCGGTTELDMGTRNWTASAWIKTTDSTGGMVIGKQGFSGGSNPDAWGISTSATGKFRAVIHEQSVTSVLTADDGTTINDGNWHLVTAVWNRNNATLTRYVDGAISGAVSTITSTLLTVSIDSTKEFQIGARDESSDRIPFTGQIDEARVYDRALSDAEVKQLYNWAPGPIGYWKLDEGTGTTANDSSGNGNNGTITAGTGGYGNGKYGKGYNFDGANSAITVGSQSIFDNLAASGGLTLETWIYARSSGEGNVGTMFTKTGWSLRFDEGSSVYVSFFADGSTDLQRSTSNNLFNLNRWNHVAVTWDGVITTASSAHIYINGVEATYQTSTDGASRVDDGSSTLYLGNDNAPGGARTVNGLLDDARIYNYPRTQAQIVEDMNAGHPAPGSPVGTPVGHWKFNEGVDNTCSGGTNDVCNSGSAGNTYDGTSTADWTNSGKYSRALDFNGTDDVVAITNATAIDMDGNLANFTFSAWVQADSDGENDTGEVFNKGTGTYLRVDNESGGLDLECNLDRATTDTNVNVADAFSTSTWAYVSCSWDGTTLRVYLNGLERGSSSSGSGAITADTANLRIGGTNTFEGRIDEFKVYNSALTASQITLDMNDGKAQVLGALSDNSTAGQVNGESQEYCIPGDSTTCTAPVWRLALEETTLTNGATIFDTSGAGKATTVANGSGPTSSRGKIGKSVDFNIQSPANAYISTTSSYAVPQTITFEAWVYPESGGEGSSGRIFSTSRTSPSLFLITNGTSCFRWRADWDTDGQWFTPANSLTLNTWQHVAVTYNSSSTSNTPNIYINGKLQSLDGTCSANITPVGTFANANGQWTIGAETSSAVDFDGKLDEVRVYDYIRTPAQIAWDYNKGLPIGHWKMDECQGTTINDSSGNGNSGTWSGSSGSNTSAGTCQTAGTAWGDGVTGKRNYSLEFDNTDDQVSMGNPAILDFSGEESFSVSAWAKLASSDAGTIIGQHEEGATNQGWRINFNSGAGRYAFQTSINGSNQVAIACSSDNAISTGVWYHITAVYNGPNDSINCYTNSIVFPTSGGVSTLFDSSANLIIGNNAGTTNYFNGQIDDVRIFNYPLTATQIKTLYNEGATRYGPVTGAP